MVRTTRLDAVRYVRLISMAALIRDVMIASAAEQVAENTVRDKKRYHVKNNLEAFLGSI